MEKIDNLNDFEEIIQQHSKLLCIVHSAWSKTSQISFSKLTKVKDALKNLQIVLVDNPNADSFIYDWLKNQEGKHWAGTQKLIEAKQNSWIQGNGEWLGLENGQLKWFLGRPFGFPLPFLKEKILQGFK